MISEVWAAYVNRDFRSGHVIDVRIAIFKIDINAHIFFLCKMHVYAGPIAPELITIYDTLASQHQPQVDLIHVLC